MKGNKKLLIVAALLLLVAVSYSTYAIYKSSATGTGSVTPAAWHVTVNSSEIMTSAQNTFTLGTINWHTPTIGQNNTIAPGDYGTVDIIINADGSQVAVDYNIELDTTNLNNERISITQEPNTTYGLSGTIPYSATAGAMQRTVTVRVEWDGVDSTTANDEDIATANSGQNISLPIVVTATQNPNPA